MQQQGMQQMQMRQPGQNGYGEYKNMAANQFETSAGYGAGRRRQIPGFNPDDPFNPRNMLKVTWQLAVTFQYPTPSGEQPPLLAQAKLGEPKMKAAPPSHPLPTALDPQIMQFL